MENRVIVFTKPGLAELQLCKVRKPKAHEVLVKLAYSTISSGTERANVSGDPNVSIASKEVAFPRYSGYSAAGTVAETGNEVTTVKPGDRVVVSWGFHMQYVTIAEENVHRIENDAVSLQSAAISMIGSFPLAAIRKCRPELGESAIVMGLGILGKIAVQLLHLSGQIPVIAADPVTERREEAIRLDADYVLDPMQEGFAEKVRCLTYGGTKIAIEVTGNGQALNQVLDCMARYGRVALLGCTRDSNFTVDYYRKVHGPGVSLIGAHTLARPQQESSPGLWTLHDDILTLLRLESMGRICLQELVGEVHLPEEATEVYRRLLTERTFPIVQFDWNINS